MNKQCKDKIKEHKNTIKELKKRITFHKKVIRKTIKQCKKKKK